MPGYNGSIKNELGDVDFDLLSGNAKRSTILTIKNGDIHDEAPIAIGGAFQKYDSLKLKPSANQTIIGCVDFFGNMILAFQAIGSGSSIFFLKISQTGVITFEYEFPLPSGYTTENDVSIKFIQRFIDEQKIVVCVGVFDSLGDEYPCLISVDDSLVYQSSVVLPIAPNNTKLSVINPDDFAADRFVVSNGLDLYCFDMSLSVLWTKTISLGSETGTITIQNVYRIISSPDESFMIVLHNADLETHLVLVSDVSGSLLDAQKVPSLPYGISGLEFSGGSSFQLYAGTGTDGEYIVASFVFEPTIARTAIAFYKTTTSGQFFPEKLISGASTVVVGKYNGGVGIGVTGPTEDFWSLNSSGTLIHASANRRFANANAFRSYCIVHEKEGAIYWTTVPFDIQTELTGGGVSAASPSEVRFGGAYSPSYFLYGSMDGYFLPGFYESPTTLSVGSGPTLTPSPVTFGTRTSSSIFTFVGSYTLNDIDANAGNFSIPQSSTTEANDSVLFIPVVDNYRVIPRIFKVIP